MRRKSIDNFAQWRKQARHSGLVKSTYPTFRKNGDLAELTGVILGDGNIGVFPRSEVLRIVANANNQGFIDRYTRLVEKAFRKKPHVKKRTYSEAVNITVYEKFISKRLLIPSGARGNILIQVPDWIVKNKEMTIRFLRGLYEAEGSYSVHTPTYTYKMFFSNKNLSLLDIVFRLVKGLGFHPHRSADKIQISRKEEVQKFKNLIEFRRY